MASRDSTDALVRDMCPSCGLFKYCESDPVAQENDDRPIAGHNTQYKLLDQTSEIASSLLHRHTPLFICQFATRTDKASWTEDDPDDKSKYHGRKLQDSEQVLVTGRIPEEPYLDQRSPKSRLGWVNKKKHTLSRLGQTEDCP
jgi:hypothetical protein